MKLFRQEAVGSQFRLIKIHELLTNSSTFSVPIPTIFYHVTLDISGII